MDKCNCPDDVLNVIYIELVFPIHYERLVGKPALCTQVRMFSHTLYPECGFN